MAIVEAKIGYVMTIDLEWLELWWRVPWDTFPS